MCSRFVGTHRFLSVRELSGIGSRVERLSVWLAFLIFWMQMHALTHKELQDCIDI